MDASMLGDVGRMNGLAARPGFSAYWPGLCSIFGPG